MKKIVSNSLREVNMSTFNNKSNLDYTDGDIAIANDIRKLGEYESNNTIKLDMVVIIMCVKGRLQVDINCNTYVIHPNDLLFCPPNIMLNDFQTSEDFEGKMIGLSERILQRLFHNSSDVWNKVFYICKNPIIHLEKESLNIFNYFYELVKLKINQSPRQYRKEVIHSILRAMLYEVYADLDRVVAPTEDNLIRQGDLLFRRFLKLLEENSGKERAVSYYAKELCVTPKYLSYACKASSQKTALKWIHDYTTESIRYQLKHSEKSIKEISDELNFPNISFFGKYVKTHFGMSPRAVRKSF